MKHKPIKRRNPFAVAAHRMNSAGPMKHRNEPRGGTRNEHQDILNEMYNEWGDKDMSNAIDNAHITHDIATITRVLPWIIGGDQRDPNTLVKCALKDVSGFIDCNERLTLLRGIVYALCNVLNVNIQPEMVEMLIKNVKSQVDEHLAEEYDDGLDGERV